MPTERFYHLPEEKKQLIREAAIKEFCRVPLEKASINKIVRNAKISRGSFYTYFQDKEDVLEYIFEDVILQLQSICKEVLVKSGGDLWELPPNLLEHTIELCQRNRLFALTQSVNGGHTLISILDKKVCAAPCCPVFQEDDDGRCQAKTTQTKQEVIQDRMQLFLKELYVLTDTSRLKISSLQEFQTVFSTCAMILVGAIGEIYQKKDDIGAVKEMFNKRLDYLKYGVVK